eukprot:symbB.v1.2.006578.t1/scaffold387.1/size215482/1
MALCLHGIFANQAVKHFVPSKAAVSKSPRHGGWQRATPVLAAVAPSVLRHLRHQRSRRLSARQADEGGKFYQLGGNSASEDLVPAAFGPLGVVVGGWTDDELETLVAPLLEDTFAEGVLSNAVTVPVRVLDQADMDRTLEEVLESLPQMDSVLPGPGEEAPMAWAMDRMILSIFTGGGLCACCKPEMTNSDRTQRAMDLAKRDQHSKEQEIRDKAASRAAELCPPQNGVGGPTAKVPKPDTEARPMVLFSGWPPEKMLSAVRRLRSHPQVRTPAMSAMAVPRAMGKKMKQLVEEIESDFYLNENPES